MNELEGYLNFWSETGSEGGHFMFCEWPPSLWDEGYNSWAYQGLHKLRDGDTLKIWKPADGGEYTVVVPGQKMRVGAEWSKRDDGRWTVDGGELVDYSYALKAAAFAWPRKLVWEGVLKRRPVKLFTEDAAGFWLNTGPQVGFSNNDWAKFFFEAYPATLTTTQEPAKWRQQSTRDSS